MLNLKSFTTTILHQNELRREKKISFFILLLCFVSSYGQTPYEISLKKDIPIAGVALAATVTSIILDSRLDPLTASQIDALDPNDVNRFDRSGINYYKSEAAYASDVFKIGAFAGPISLIVSSHVRKDFTKVGLLGVEAFLINGALTAITKGIVKRPRPYVYNPNVPFEKKNRVSARLSFFSGHTSSVSVLTFFSAKVFADCHPDSKWKPVVWGSAALLSSTTGFLRYRAGRHFKTDVITGMTVGALVGILIPQAHKKKDKKTKASLSVSPTVNGAEIVLIW